MMMIVVMMVMVVTMMAIMMVIIMIGREDLQVNKDTSVRLCCTTIDTMQCNVLCYTSRLH